MRHLHHDDHPSAAGQRDALRQCREKLRDARRELQACRRELARCQRALTPYQRCVAQLEAVRHEIGKCEEKLRACRQLQNLEPEQENRQETRPCPISPVRKEMSCGEMVMPAGTRVFRAADSCSHWASG